MLLLLKRKRIELELEQEGLLVGIIDLFPCPALFKQGLLLGVCLVYKVRGMCTLGLDFIFAFSLVSIDLIKVMASF